MSSPANWLPVVGILAVAGGVLLGIRRFVDRKTAEIRSVMDACDYVVIEAVPEQLPAMREDFEGQGWRLGETKPTGQESMLYRFDKVDGLATPLSQLLGFGEKQPKSCASGSGSHFQMKIKAHGLRTDLNVAA